MNTKFGYHAIWLIPYYFAYQIYLAILEKWFPRKFKKIIGIQPFVHEDDA